MIRFRKGEDMARKAAQCGAAAVALILCLAVFPARVGAGPPIQVVQHNIRRTNINSVYYAAVASGPLVITTQEVCDSALQQLEDLIVPQGYGFLGITGGPNEDCPGDVKRLWVVVFVKAYVPGSGAAGYVLASRPDKVWACVVGRYGKTWRGCTFHLTPDNYQFAWEESEAMRQRLTRGIAAEPTVVGADFNLRPRDFGVYSTSLWRPDWWEGDNQCYLRDIDRKTYDNPNQTYYRYCPSPRRVRDVKIDYTWADRFNFLESSGLATIDYGSGSDHYLYVTDFVYK